MPTKTEQPIKRYRAKARHKHGECDVDVCHETGHIYGIDPNHAFPMSECPAHIRKQLVGKSRFSLRKAVNWVDWKNDPSYRWITISGRTKDGEKSEHGVPVLIKVGPDGSGHVVGGAGGSLTGLKLTRLRSPEELKVEAKKRKEISDAKAKTRKASMPKEELRELEKRKTELEIKTEEAKAEAIAQVAAALGWKEGTRLPDEVTSMMDQKQVSRLQRKRNRHLLAQVQEAVNAVKDEVINQHNIHVAEQLQDVDIDDIATPEVSASGRGYMDTITELAKENGFTTGLGRAVASNVMDDRLVAAEREGYIEDAQAARDAIEGLQAAAANARAEDAPYIQEGVTKPETSDPVAMIREDPERAKTVLSSWQKFKELERQTNELNRAMNGDDAGNMDNPAIARGVALLSAGNIDDAAAEKAAEEALTQHAMVRAASTLVTEAENFEAKYGSLNQHLQGARYGQLAAMYAQVAGEPLPIDRRIVDLLGIDAAARLAAAALKERHGDKFDEMRDALINRHVKTQATLAELALERAMNKIDEANALIEGLPTVGNSESDDLLMIQSKNQERLASLGEAGRELGQALGKIEAAGHLNNAMNTGIGKNLTVSMGQISTADALKAAQALGFDRSEFEIEADGVNRFLKIKRGPALEKLLEVTDPGIARDSEMSMSIKKGQLDEENWLPEGFSKRSRTDYAGAVQAVAPYDVDPKLKMRDESEIKFALPDYIGRCLAENGAGSLNEIRNRLLDPSWLSENVDEENQQAVIDWTAENLKPDVIHNAKKGGALAEEFISKATRADKTRTPLDNQTIAADDPKALEAVHQALAAFPKARAAFKPLSQLELSDKAALRAYFYDDVMGISGDRVKDDRKRREALQAKLDNIIGHQMDIFGESNAIRYGDTEAGKAEWEAEYGNQKVDPWEFYVESMGGIKNAYIGLQQSMQGKFLEGFSDHYEKLTGHGLRKGEAELHKATRFKVGTMTPEQYETWSGGLKKEQRERLDELRTRRAAGTKGGGQFASGSVKDLLTQIDESNKKYGVQAFTDTAGDTAPKRFSLGKTAEQQVARLASHLAPNFDPKNPISTIYDVSMSGKYAPQQRGIKLVENLGRVGMHLKTGAGKTPVGLGAFSHLHSKGKVKRGLFVVPPKQTGQWGAEALRFIEPGKLNHFTAAGKTADERRAAYGNADTHLVMVGHQALRDDITWAVAKHNFDGDEHKAAQALIGKALPNETPSQTERRVRDMVQSAMDKEGWNFDFSCLDEAHDALNRKGKANSRLANVMDAATENHKYHINATATAVKNDVSEAFDLLHKLRPDRYPLEKRDGFMRRYGSTEIPGVAEALQREVSPYMFASGVDTGVTRKPSVLDVKMTPKQKSRYREVHQAYLTAKRNKPGTLEHVQAVLKMFPKSELEGLSPDEQAAAVDRAGKFLSARRDAMLRRVVYGHDEELGPEDVGGFNAIERIAQSHKRGDFDGGQLPGVVFAHNPGVARKLTDYLNSRGFRAGVFDGTMSTEEADKARNGFFPQNIWDESDPIESTKKLRAAASHDILVCSDAASQGLNLQRGAWMAHVDAPYTAKTYQQRNGRTDRIGALHDTQHYYDLDHDAPVSKRQRAILTKKTPITEAFQQPYELLDQDDTGEAGRIIGDREARLSSAVNSFAGHAPMPFVESEDSVLARDEYQQAEAAGQASMFD